MSSLSVNRILANHANVVREAVITASAQRPAGAPRLVGQSRQGRGGMALTGDYQGATDSLIDIEVTAGSGSQLRTTAPLISGVGNGQLDVTAVDVTAVPETVTFRLAGAGDPATRAQLAFFGVTLLAREAGAAGNAITLTVTRRLNLSAPIGATLAELPAGTVDLPDARWDFGAATATGPGLPLTAPRLLFTGYPAIHRHWRAWVDGVWVYRLDPALPYAVPANTAIRRVTGDYRLVLSDGTTTETYDAITHFEFLSAVRSRSALVEVVGAVAKDTAPGGMGMLDIQLRTDAYALPVIANIKGPDGKTYLDNVVVKPAALTENLLLTCRANTGAAPAKWSVVGGASGTLPDAETGKRYPGGPVAFTIPAVPLPPQTAPITTKVSLVGRAEGEPQTSVCLLARTGAKATAKSVTFIYTRRPSTDCDCTTLPMPKPNPFCLGVDDGGNGMALDPDYLSRLQALYDWRADFQGTQADTSVPTDAKWAQQDMDLCDQAVGLLAATLEQIYAEDDALAGWDAEFTRLKSEFGPMAGVGRVAPAAIAVGMAVGALGQNPLNRYTYQLARVQSFMAPAGGDAPVLLAKDMAVGTVGLNPINQRAYRLDACVFFSEHPEWTPGGDEAQSTLKVVPDFVNWDWPTGGGAVTRRVVAGSTYEVIDGRYVYYDTGYNITFTDLGEAGQGGATVQRDLATLTTPVNLSGAWKTTDGATFTLSTQYPGDNAGSERSTWICRGLPADLNANVAVDQLARRYQARMDAVLTLAGIVPKSDASSGGGDGCWRDPGDPFYWEDDSGVYLPAFNNSAYVSCAIGCGVLAKEGDSYSTQEFGFGLAVDCIEALKVGDKFTITINGGTSGPYAEGDTFTIPVIGALPARFAGGAEGSSVQTWAVSGTVGGAYPDWPWDPTAPTPYTAGPLDATLAPGGIPFELGDQIRVALEGGTLRWRRDAGAWTAGDLYDPDGQDLGDGLTLRAVPGAAPSFLTGDAWRFQALATHGPDRLRQPREGQAFAWDGDVVDLTLDLGSVQPIEALLLALHTLPPTATVEVFGGELAADEWAATIPWNAGPMLKPLAGNLTARYLTLFITGAGAGASIGWLWAGVPWAPTAGVSSLQQIRQYGLSRGAGRNPSARYSGRGTGGRWAWELSADAALLPDDVAGLLTLLDHVAEQGLEWVCLVPDIRQPATATLAQIDADAVTLTEELGYWLDGAALTSVELPFRAVLR